jgi:amino acid permease
MWVLDHYMYSQADIVQGGWDVQSFLTSYFGIGFVIVMFTFWKLYHKTRFVRLHEMDFVSRIAEFDKLEAYYAAK